MAKFYPKRESDLDFSGIAMVLSFLVTLGCGLVSCHSHLDGNTTDDFEHANEQNYTNNFQNARNLSDQYGNVHDFDDTYNLDFDDAYDQGTSMNQLLQGIENGHESHDIDEVIIGLLDEDKNGLVSLEEMINWIRYTRDRITTKSVEKQWREYNDGKDLIGWDKYSQIVYGFLNHTSRGENDDMSHEEMEAYSEMKRMDKQRWDNADENGDGFLTKSEFGHYLFPNFEDSIDQDMIVQDAVADMDINGDGKVSFDEYIESLDNAVVEGGISEEFAELASEKFHEVRDLNGDGFLDKEEIRLWIMPRDFDPVIAEAKYIIQESDSNSDGMVTISEILALQLPTNFQPAIYNNIGTGHDEL